MSVPTNLIPTKITGLPEYQGTSVDGYLPYVIDGRTYKVRFGNIAAVGAVPSTRRVATGTGLAGGGDLSEDRTIYIPNGGVGDDQLSATGVTGGTYGSSTQIPIITVDFKGRLTSASSVALEVPVLDLSDPSKTQGALPLGRGGTGSVISPASGAIPYSTASGLALTPVGLPGQVLASNGSGVPYWETVTGTGTVTSVDASGGTTGLTFTGGPVTTVGTLTLGGTLAITHGGTGAADAATARVNIGAAASGANNDITSLSGITGAIGTPDYIDFDTAATVTRATGRLWWDNADGNQTLSLGMAGSNATLQVGQEMYFRIRASAAITEGQGVMFTGTVGASGALTGAPASGLTKDTASYFMGVATEDIPLNSWGYVTQFGLVRGINTTGGAEAWVDGQILYYNPAVPGGLTKTVPAAPAAKIEVAAVVHAASNGSIFVRPISRFSLGQLNDLETSAASDLDLLQYNGPAGYWQHKSPSLISVGSATNLAGGAANRIAYQTGAGATGFIVAPTVANTYLEWSGSGFQWSANPLGTVTSVDASGGTTGLTFSGGPVTTAGTLTLGGTLAVASGGTGATTAPNARTNLGATTVGSSFFTLTNPSAITFPRINADNTVSALSAADFRAAIGVGTGTGTVTSVDVSGGTTGLTFSGGPVTSSGTITMAGTLGVANGGTGATSFTSGYLLKGNGTSAVNTSNVYDDGVNVGVGTSTPNARLTVAGAITSYQAGVTDQIIFTPQTAGSGALLLAVNEANNAYRQMTIDGSPVVINTAGTERMRVDGAGNVGIGTTSITGIFGRTVQISDGSQNGSLSVVGTGGSGFVATSGSVFAVTARGGMALTLGTNDTEKVRISTAGFVGIGTSSPSSKLTVLDGDIEVNATGLGNTLLSFNGTTANLTVNSSSAPLVFGTNSTERMRITSGGEVGIGLTPSHVLDVYSAANGIIRVGGGNATNQGAAFYVKNANNSNTQAAFGDRARIFGGTPDQLVSIFTSALPLTFDVNGSERARFDTSGNLGIGTTSPGGKLDVTGSVYLRGVPYLDSDGSSNYLRIGPSGTYIQNSGGGSNFGFWSNTGDLAVGTVSNAAKLSIAGATLGTTAGDISNITYAAAIPNTNNMQLYTRLVRVSNGTDWTTAALRLLSVVDSSQMTYIDMITTGGNSNLAFGTGFGAPTERMRIDTNGNVGIGTTSPLAKLDLGSAVGQKLLTYGNGNIRYGLSVETSEWRAFAAQAAVLTFGHMSTSDGTTFTERMRIDASGNVGIGTTNPIYPLMVSNGGAAGLEFAPTAVASAPVIQSYNRSGAAYTQLTYSALRHVFWNSGTERMRIESDGTVQVGGTGETQKLNVITNTGTSGMENSFGISNQVDSNCFIRVSGSANGDKKTTIGPSTGTSLVFNTADTERMRIDASGLVGIGMNSQAIRGTLDVSLGNIATAGVERSIHFGYSAADYYGFRLVNINSPTSFAAGTFSIQRGTTAAWESAVFINNAGQVGIGTNNPITTLHVTGASGTSSGSLSLSPSSSGGGASYILMGNNDSAGVAGPTVIVSANRNLQFGVGNSFSSASGGTLTEYMRITETGNVGIGTSNPSAKLHVVGGSSTLTLTNTDAASFAGVAFTDGPNTQGQIWVGNGSYASFGGAGSINYSANSGPHVWYTNYAERMRITSGGQLLLGTTSLATKFGVYGYDATYNNTATFSSGLASQYLDILCGFALTNGTPGGVASNTTMTLRSSGSSAGELAFATGNTEAMRITAGGNVGIGTTAPGTKLMAYGTSGTAISLNNATTGTTSTSGFQLQTGSGGDAYIWNYSNSFIAIATTNTERMRITSGGDVGIGTSSISAKLHVYGGAGGINSIFDSNTSSDTRIELRNNGTRAGYIYWDSGEVRLLADSSRVTTFYVGGTERFRLTTTGGITSADVADAVGYKGLPQNSQTTGYTLALSDMGKHISITTGNITIPANGSVAFPVGAAVTIFNNSGSTQTISITTDTLRQAGTTNTGTRTLAAYGVATVLKVASTTWVISGNVT